MAHKTLYSATKYPFFSSVYVTFTNIDYDLGHETNLSKYKRIEIIQRMFSVNNGIKLEIGIRMITGDSPYS